MRHRAPGTTSSRPWRRPQPSPLTLRTVARHHAPPLGPGETVSSDGCWKFQDATIAPLPPDGVEVWVGAVASPAIDCSARIGDGWLASPGLVPTDAAAASADYLEPSAVAVAVAVRRDIYVGENEQEALDTTARIRERGYRGRHPDATVVGGPETVAKAFRDLAQSSYTDIIVRNMMPTQKHAVASIRRLAEVRAMVSDA